MNDTQNTNQDLQWLLCPKCGKKTRLKLRPDTELKNFPLYCPKCKEMTLVDVKNFEILSQKELGVRDYRYSSASFLKSGKDFSMVSVFMQ